MNVVSNPKLFNTAPAIETERIEHDGRLVIRVWVPAGPSVASFRHVVYDRVADVDRRVTGEMQIAQMHIRKQNHFSEQHVYRYLKPSDFRLDLLPRVRKMAVLKTPGHPWAEMDDMELMRSAGLYGVNYDTGEEGFNLAAVMLLGRDEVIASVAPAYKTDAIVRRENLDRYDDRLIVTTNLVEAHAMVSGFAKRHLPDRFMLEGDRSVSPRDVIIRELVSNLMIHREFVSPYPAKFLILNDGIHTENASRAISPSTASNRCPRTRSSRSSSATSAWPTSSAAACATCTSTRSPTPARIPCSMTVTCSRRSFPCAGSTPAMVSR